MPSKKWIGKKGKNIEIMHPHYCDMQMHPALHYTFGRKHKTQKTDFGQYDEVAFLACFLIPP
jgi:hypothetical protein